MHSRIKLLALSAFLSFIALATYSHVAVSVKETALEPFAYSQLQTGPGVAGTGYIDTFDLKINAAELSATNPDFRGWLFLPNTGISLPVVSGRDNSYYLHHSFYGGPSAYGTLFFDTTSTDTAVNRVIHGHNMGKGRKEMFSSLVNYQGQAYADDHKVLYFIAPDNTVSVYSLFAVLNRDTKTGNKPDYRTPFFAEAQDYWDFVSSLKEESLIKLSYLPTGEELMILSTCNRTFGETNRLLVCFGKNS